MKPVGEKDRRPETSPVGRTSLALGHALRLRCPACGTRGIVDGWLGDPRTCPGCGLRGDRGEEDYFLGPLLLNLVITELAAAGLVAVAVVLTWPDPPWDAVLWGGVVLAVILPAAGLPFSRLLWLAADLHLRPWGEDED